MSVIYFKYNDRHAELQIEKSWRGYGRVTFCEASQEVARRQATHIIDLNQPIYPTKEPHTTPWSGLRFFPVLEQNGRASVIRSYRYDDKALIAKAQAHFAIPAGP